MNVHLIAVGTRLPRWAQQGYEEYARRLPRECGLRLIEIPPAKRAKTVSRAQVLQAEGERMLQALPKRVLVVALDADGQRWGTEALSRRLGEWQQGGQDVALLIGGADGLADPCKQRADVHWSLSPAIFPHALVRIMVAEQVYRAWSLLKGLPYHRG